MSAEFTSEPIEQRGPWLGLVAMLGAAALVLAYYTLPFMHEDWPPSFYPLFWCAIGAAVTFGVGQIAVSMLPRIWFRLPRFSRHHMHLPREGYGFLIIMFVCFLGASMTHSNPLMLVFAAMVGPFIVTGSVTYAMLKNLRVVRQPPRRAMAGELFSVELTLQNQSRVVSAWLMTVRDEVRHASESLRVSVLFTRVARRSEMTGHYQLRLAHRGRYRFGPIQVFSRYPLGLVERSCTFGERGELLVYPQIGRLSTSWKRRLFSATELIESSQNRIGMFDDEFHHLREYRPGDNPRAIHWRSSARRNELIVREYQTNREHDMMLLVDLHANDPTRPLEQRHVEQALSVVATVCWEHRRECRGASLTVVLCGRETWRWEASTASSGLDTLLDKLALAEPAMDAHFSQVAPKELAHIGPTTRTVAITTREEPTGIDGVHMPIQWLRITDALFSELLRFELPQPRVSEGTQESDPSGIRTVSNRTDPSFLASDPLTP